MGDPVEVRLTDVGLSVVRGGVTWIQEVGIEFPYAGEERSSFTGGFELATACPISGYDRGGYYYGYALTYTADGKPIVVLTARAYPEQEMAVMDAEALVELTGIRTADSFLHTTFNAPVFRLADSGFLLYTWGLSDAGGEWPHTVYGESLTSVPQDRPFSPLVLVRQGGVMVISPGSHYPMSPLRAGPERGTVVRGLHGAIDRIPRGAVVSTVIQFGSEPFSTLFRWGDVIRAGRPRPNPLAHRILARLGYWNDYGAYYSELLHPINEELLLALGDYFREEEIPIGYFGLDLWYPHDRVGFATAYRADENRFPSGLGRIKTRTGIPFFLHLSGFDLENEYRDGYHFLEGDGAACPRERRFYSDLGRRLKEKEGAIGIWHDHVRVYQERIPALRASLTAGEEWFTMMTDGLGENGLPLMLSDPTVGFLLAAAGTEAIVSSRSGDDYLVKQPGQLAQLDPVAAARYKYVPPQRFIVDRFLVGWLLYSLGLLPFHDVFITNPDHPDGFAEPDAASEALMRALSAGPIGIGDKLGEVNKEIVDQLVFPDGVLAKPDHPAQPLWNPLARDLVVGVTDSVDGKWRYVAVFNAGDDERSYDSQDVSIDTGRCIIYSYFQHRIVTAIQGSLSPGQGDYYVLTPVFSGIAVIGFIDKFITAPTDRIRAVTLLPTGVEVTIHIPPNNQYRLGVFSKSRFQVAATGATITMRTDHNGLTVLTIIATAPEVVLRLEREVRS